MRYALIKFRVHLLGTQTFAVYTDHASLRTATKSPHLSQRMARWLSFFAEYNFVVHYKGCSYTNILADALSLTIRASRAFPPRLLTSTMTKIVMLVWLSVFIRPCRHRFSPCVPLLWPRTPRTRCIPRS